MTILTPLALDPWSHHRILKINGFKAQGFDSGVSVLHHGFWDLRSDKNGLHLKGNTVEACITTTNMPRLSL